jgi:glutathione synthase/RimK-type ligase-like ATP-grasp enzyme
VIVVISHPEDPHAACVLDLLREEQHEVLLLDLSDLPAKAALTVDYADPAAPRVEYLPADGAAVDLAAATAVWWRRPQVPDVASVADIDARMFTANEWNEAINGLWQLMPGRWMNPPHRDEVAGRKAHQLHVAAALGLRVPRTLITSDPDRARAFIAATGVGRTIFKTFSATHAVWRETRLVRDAELANLDSVRVAPVIFQEYVPVEADVRVTVVGDALFPAAIDARGTDYEVDFRMSLGQARTVATELPGDVAARIRALMQRLGLAYGAIDLRRTPSGEHVFLEVNTAGEFLFVEERTGQPISRALAGWLARSESPRPPRAAPRQAEPRRTPLSGSLPS